MEAAAVCDVKSVVNSTTRFTKACIPQVDDDDDGYVPAAKSVRPIFPNSLKSLSVRIPVDK